jgi:FkbM family methyltransferase
VKLKSTAKGLAYGMADLCTARRGIRRTIGGRHVRFPARWSRYYPADYEPETFAFLEAHCQPGQTVMDIGAHLGLFTVTMAQLVGPSGRVLSFEPTTSIQPILEQVVRINGVARTVELRREAVSDSAGVAHFYETGHFGSNACSLVRTARSRRVVEVPTISIDELVRSREMTVHCLKIDVEGAEVAVLRGALETMGRCRPAISLAVHPAAIGEMGSSLEELWRLVQDAGMASLSQSQPVDRAWFVGQTDLFDVHLLPR